MKSTGKAVMLAMAAAVFYALGMPLSKLLLAHIPPTMMASFLYFGAGVGIGFLYVCGGKKTLTPETRLTKEDLPYTVAMIVLDIAAPVFLMIGLADSAATNASLLNNFEIVATSLIAFLVFKEQHSLRLWVAIILITVASVLLSLQEGTGFAFSTGSLFVLAACGCWGLENNCTRKLSEKNTYEIVILKGMFSGLGSLVIALAVGEKFPHFVYFLLAMAVGFVAYGLSIFVYVKAQSVLGAAKTSAYYAIAPFVGCVLGFAFLKEQPSKYFFVALTVMIVGTVLTTLDALGIPLIRKKIHK